MIDLMSCALMSGFAFVISLISVVAFFIVKKSYEEHCDWLQEKVDEMERRDDSRCNYRSNSNRH